MTSQLGFLSSGCCNQAFILKKVIDFFYFCFYFLIIFWPFQIRVCALLCFHSAMIFLASLYLLIPTSLLYPIVSDLCSHCLLGDTVLPIAHIPQWWGDEAVECASVAYPMVVACLQPLEWAQ